MDRQEAPQEGGRLWTGGKRRTSQQAAFASAAARLRRAFEATAPSPLASCAGLRCRVAETGREEPQGQRCGRASWFSCCSVAVVGLPLLPRRPASSPPPWRRRASIPSPVSLALGLNCVLQTLPPRTTEHTHTRRTRLWRHCRAHPHLRRRTAVRRLSRPWWRPRFKRAWSTRRRWP